MGRWAIARLTSAVAGADPTGTALLPVHLVVRNSTAVAPRPR